MENIKFIIDNEGIKNLWREIIDYRNDIDHAGWRISNYHRSSSFKSKLDNFIDEAEKIIRCE
ncbi:MAG: hypothetical protein ACPL7B_06015 [Candidatus Poribacteria bacterium]